MTDAPPPGPLPGGGTRGDLVMEVRRAVGGVPQSARVVVAVSGGPDSTACAFLLAEARPDLSLVLAHVRHGLRDDRSDLAAVQTHASWLGLPIEIVEVTVDPQGRGVEDEARQQRHAALRRIARQHDSGFVALGHTADDQAETLLLRLARGTGIDGLAGMAPVRGDLLRPLLRLRRHDVHRFVELEGLPCVQDPTNTDRRFRRNLVRLDVLPPFSRAGPDVVGAMGRLADLARDDARALDELAASRATDVVRRTGPVRSMPSAFLDEDPAIVRRVLRELVREVRGGGDPPTAAEIETLRTLDHACDLSGVVAVRAGGWFAVAPADVAPPAPTSLDLPGRVRWPGTEWTLRASTADSVESDQPQLGLVGTWAPPKVRVHDRHVPPGGDPALAQVVFGGLPDGLARLQVRSREPGDRVLLPAGHRKLQDVMVDAGVPRPLRPLLPVVALDEQVLWVPGLAVDEEARLAGLAQPLVHLAVTSGRG